MTIFTDSVATLLQHHQTHELALTLAAQLRVVLPDYLATILKSVSDGRGTSFKKRHVDIFESIMRVATNMVRPKISVLWWLSQFFTYLLN